MNLILKSTVAIFAAACVSFAEIKLPEIFSDSMVLQRNAPVKIWGMADANAAVVVEFAGQKKSAKAGADGKWKIELSPMEASEQSREIKIYENGKLSKTISDVLVGEVWILGGQSNMQWALASTDDAKQAIARADNYPNLRYFKQDPNRWSENEEYFIPQAKWIVSNSRDAGNFSAVGYYFGEKLLRDLKVPVGLVNVCLGGTSMRAWTPAEYIDKVEFNKKWMAHYNKMRDDYLKNGGYEKKVADMKIRRAKFEAACKKADSEGKPRPSEWDFRVSTPLKSTHESMNGIPIYHWNAKVAPVAGLGARGVLWYQGESDGWGDDPKHSPSFVFDQMYVNMVRAWRERWGDSTLFFLAAQLPSKGHSTAWPRVRAMQVAASDELGRAACANIIDTGWENDVHPHDKTLVGHRLEQVALGQVYADKSIAPTPRAQTADFQKGGAIVKIFTFGDKLQGRGSPRGFELKIDGKWVAAKPELRGKSVFVASPDSESIPTGVRYLWKPWAKPDVWLYNSQGTPVFSFLFE